MTTIGTLFSGGEGVGVGARAAGLRHVWGVEIDDDIAQVARDNGFDVRTANIHAVDPADYEPPTVLHASPPCPNYSVAKQGRRETNSDIALASAVAQFIRVLQPQYFTLENVYLYRKSESWDAIYRTLKFCGYHVDMQHINAANFGVPQTRKRMVVRASFNPVPPLPEPEPWIGWYEAIEDLIPTLPESQFAPWQLKGMPAELLESMLVDSAGWVKDGVRIPVMRPADQPANTIIANHGRRPMRAFLVGGANASRAPTIRKDNEPMFTVTAGIKHPHRAFLIGGQYGRPANKTGEPRPPQMRGRDEPVFTVTAVNKGDWRAWLEHGKIVQMTPRALARFQSFPDSYALPSTKTLACRIVGMAVPPLLYQKLVSQLTKGEYDGSSGKSKAQY